MRDQASILEHVASAMNGSDNSDWLGALAMAQAAPGAIRASDSRLLQGVVVGGARGAAAIVGLGASITRLQTTTSRLTVTQARDSIAALVRKLNEVRRWRLSDKHVERVAESTLLLHLHPTCPYCNGQKHELIADTPVQDVKRPCARCAGTGNRPMPRRNPAEVAYVLNVLGIIQGLTERAVEKRMR
jgi:hypothetical protein